MAGRILVPAWLDYNVLSHPGEQVTAVLYSDDGAMHPIAHPCRAVPTELPSDASQPRALPDHAPPKSATVSPDLLLQAA